MNLKQVEISGFKSFAKKSVLDFKTSITAIVGPNGSGKSNVAEAFSFVLGEQSIKSLRGKKGEDLIYNGSESGTRSNRASVKVVFDNKKRLLDIDFDEVSIERQVHRDGVNQYLINGSTVRLKDIIELLSGANIGSTGHHIISQGEADRILTDNPKERKAVIEDALGLRIYQIKRRESEKKLERTEENIKQVSNLRKEIKPHLSFLEKQAIKIEKTLDMKKGLVEMYKEYFKREDVYIKEQKGLIEANSKVPKERLKELEEKILKLEKEAGKGRDTSLESKALRDTENQINDLRQEKGKLILGLGRYEGELKSLQKILASKPEVKESQVSLSKVEDLIREVEEKIESLKEEQNIPKFRSILMEIGESLKGFLGGVSGPKVSVNYDGEIKIVEERIKETHQEIESLIKEEQKLKGKFENLAKEIEENKDTGIKAEREGFDLKEEKNEIVMKLREVKILAEKIEIEEGDYKRELTSAAVLAGREAINFENLKVEKEEDREDQDKRRREIEKIKIRLEDAGGASGEEIMSEYKEVKERDEFLEREIEDLKASAISLISLIKDLEDKLEKEFSLGLDKINNQFQEFFSLMFGGGNASLTIVRDKKVQKADSEAEFSEENSASEEEDTQTTGGIEIEVSLPRKRIKGLMMLSGGERALTSIALLFAMSQVNPPPFIILDETDAALDEANSKKYGDMITTLSAHSQLILITHNRETMSRAGVLYGVTMDSTGVSKLLSVDLQEAVEVAK